jgi:hypothetical protein
MIRYVIDGKPVYIPRTRLNLTAEAIKAKEGIVRGSEATLKKVRQLVAELKPEENRIPPFEGTWEEYEKSKGLRRNGIKIWKPTPTFPEPPVYTTFAKNSAFEKKKGPLDFEPLTTFPTKPIYTTYAKNSAFEKKKGPLDLEPLTTFPTKPTHKTFAENKVNGSFSLDGGWSQQQGGHIGGSIGISWAKKGEEQPEENKVNGSLTLDGGWSQQQGGYVSGGLTLKWAKKGEQEENKVDGSFTLGGGWSQQQGGYIQGTLTLRFATEEGEEKEVTIVEVETADGTFILPSYDPDRFDNLVQQLVDGEATLN